MKTDPIPTADFETETTNTDYDDAVIFLRQWDKHRQTLERNLHTSPDSETLKAFITESLELGQAHEEFIARFPETEYANYFQSMAPVFSARQLAYVLMMPGVGDPIPADVVSGAFKSEEDADGVHRLIASGIRGDDRFFGSHDLGPAQFVFAAYGVTTYADLLRKLDMSNEFDVSVREDIFKPDSIRMVAFGDTRQVEPGSSKQEYQQAAREAYRSYVAACVPEATDSFHDAVAFGLTRSGSADRTFGAAIRHIDHIGHERAQALYEQYGTTLFGSYNTSQLDLMIKVFLDHDKQELERLHNTDSRIVFINSGGDHSGALYTIPELYQDDDSATLFIEVETFRDIYRGFVALRQRNIQPSSVVFAQHAFGGQMNLTMRSNPDGSRRSAEGVHSASQDWIEEYKGVIKEKHNATLYSIYTDANGFARLVHTYMQPSHTSDEKQIILHGCELAKEVPKQTMTESSKESTSFMRDLVTVIGAEESVRIFGLGDSMMLHRSKDGTALEATAPAERSGDMESQRRPFDATCIEIIAGGTVSEFTQSQIPLHK